MIAGRVKIVSHSSCRASAKLKYFCPLLGLSVMSQLQFGNQFGSLKKLAA